MSHKQIHDNYKWTKNKPTKPGWYWRKETDPVNGKVKKRPAYINNKLEDCSYFVPISVDTDFMCPVEWCYIPEPND